MKNPLAPVICLLLLSSLVLRAAPDPAWPVHDRNRPAPPVVTPGLPTTMEAPGTAPSDAVVLFDGKDLAAWVAMDGSPTGWAIKDGVLECQPESGMIRTRQAFGDCQLHIEWTAPLPVSGQSQGRGNSGVFFGPNRYELQVLDSYDNRTYADGSAAAIYGQYPPLVNAMRPPGQWQVYDVIWTAPRFDASGQLRSPARLTAFHNGVLVQNNVELTGPTPWIDRPPYQAHTERLAIAMQDHGNRVRYRNIWVRELGSHRFPQYHLADALLDSYAGDYGPDARDVAKVRRLPDGLLSLAFAGFELTMHAAAPDHFYALTTDVQCKFDFSGGKKRLLITVGEPFERAMVRPKLE